MWPGLRTVTLEYEKLAPTLKFGAVSNALELREEWLGMVYRGPLPRSIFIFTGGLFSPREMTVADLQWENERSGHLLPKCWCYMISFQQFHARDLCVLALAGRPPVLVCLFSPEFPGVLQFSTAREGSLPFLSPLSEGGNWEPPTPTH